MSDPLQLPYDLANERAVLGACLVEREAITVVRALLAIEDFYLEKHGQIYRAMLDLVDQRTPPDLVTVAGQLRELGQLELVGGLAYLGELCSEVPTAVHVESYAQRVAKTAAQRRVIQLGAEIQVKAYEGGDVATLFARLQDMLEITRRASQPKSNWEEAVVPARMLYAFKFEPTRFIIEDILPEGTMLLTGKPKTRKSWLALNWAWAVAAGGRALGKYEALRGDALYIDLEMGQRRLHKRMHVVSPEQEPPRGFQFATSWPKVGEGFETWLRDYLKSHPYTRLVVVDTLIGVRPPRSRYADPYEADKTFTQALTDLAKSHRLAMVLVHHSRKADGSDVTDDASGSTGLTGGVDNFAALRLSRHQKEAGELLLVGRDIEKDDDLQLRWDARLAQWNVSDEAVNLTPERRDVLGVLSDRPGLKPRELALILRRDEGGTKRLLSNMKDAGLVFNSGGCWFVSDDDDDEDAVSARR